MKLKMLLLAAALTVSVSANSKDYTVTSPDGRITLNVNVNEDVRWSVSYDGNQIIAPSPVAMQLETISLPGSNPAGAKPKVTEVNTTLTPVVPHKNSLITDNYRELALRFREGFSLLFRVYDDGVAYRFTTSLKGEVTVTGETFGLSLPSGATAWYPLEESFMSHNERTFFAAGMDTVSRKHMASLPVLFKSKGINILLSEADIRDYPGMWVTGDDKGGVSGIFPAYPETERARGDRNVYVTARKNYLAKTEGTRSFPWRVCIITPDDAGLVESDMIYRLGAPSEIADPSWIRPGKVAWDWWNANNIYGVDFKAGLNTETYKYYIDFASGNGIEYVVLDEGWYKLGNVLSVADGFDIPEICRYASEKNVGIILWVVWKTFYDQMDEALARYREWGVKGVKVDFMQRDDQWMVNCYHEIAAKAAESHMLVDFHGAYKPDGMERRWPNVITREGVKGLEHNKWSDECNPEHDLILPFTRMVAGPMDYTPGAMVNMQKKDFSPVFNRPASQGTRAHQMAMYVVYESPLMMLADSPSNYKREQECTDFIVSVPVTWDETRVLSAQAGDYIVIARRHANDWYLAGMTDWTGRTLTADLSFLEPGRYNIEFFADGINADRRGEDYIRSTHEVTAKDKVEIPMAPGGGWVARITR